MATKNDITGDTIKSKLNNKAYSNGYDLWMENIRKEKLAKFEKEISEIKSEMLNTENTDEG